MTWNRERTINEINGAFDREGLETVLLNKLNIRLDDLVTVTKRYPDQLSEMIQSLVEDGRLADVLNALREARPQNPSFQDQMKLAIAALEQAKKEGKSADEIWVAGSPSEPLWKKAGAYLRTQTKFYAGVIATSAIVAIAIFMLPSDQVAIKTLNEAGDPIDTVSLFYYPKKTVGLKLVERIDDDYRIFLNDISEPIAIRLEVNEATAPPQFVGNNRPTPLIQVQKVSFDNSMFWFWNPRRLYLFVKISSSPGGSR